MAFGVGSVFVGLSRGAGNRKTFLTQNSFAWSTPARARCVREIRCGPKVGDEIGMEYVGPQTMAKFWSAVAFLRIHGSVGETKLVAAPKTGLDRVVAVFGMPHVREFLPELARNRSEALHELEITIDHLQRKLSFLANQNHGEEEEFDAEKHHEMFQLQQSLNSAMEDSEQYQKGDGEKATYRSFIEVSSNNGGLELTKVRGDKMIVPSDATISVFGEEGDARAWTTRICNPGEYVVKRGSNHQLTHFFFSFFFPDDPQVRVDTTWRLCDAGSTKSSSNTVRSHGYVP